VSLESEPDRGTTVRVALPVADVAAARSEARVILVADDEPLVRASVVRMLERAGHRVLAADDGEHALEIFEQSTERIDLVLLDVVMPRLGGFETYERMQMLRPDLPVLFTSGYSRTSSEHPVIRKPYRRTELLEQIEAALRRR
jgi:CheY-like chemotaxis protein